ncbi:MAG: ABC transporter ATP-binding protein, partial [Actinobacteria bacterium]
MNTNLFTEKKNKTKKSAEQIVVKVENVSKNFRLYADKPTSFKEMVVQGVRRRQYSTFRALKDVSFEVKKGKTLGIIGENGSGKSTLLKILTGVYKPTEGKAGIDGKVSGLLELGAGFHPELTGRENIYI